jgi:hypothetical protein
MASRARVKIDAISTLVGGVRGLASPGRQILVERTAQVAVVAHGVPPLLKLWRVAVVEVLSSTGDA